MNEFVSVIISGMSIRSAARAAINVNRSLDAACLLRDILLSMEFIFIRSFISFLLLLSLLKHSVNIPAKLPLKGKHARDKKNNQQRHHESRRSQFLIVQ